MGGPEPRRRGRAPRIPAAASFTGLITHEDLFLASEGLMIDYDPDGYFGSPLGSPLFGDLNLPSLGPLSPAISRQGRCSSSGSRDSSPTSPRDRRATSKTRRRSKSKTHSRSASAPLGFVNFTPDDSRKILTGVAPSGSSKTKARREKEAAEKRRRLSQAAAKAVLDAGGDLRCLEREGLFAA